MDFLGAETRLRIERSLQEHSEEQKQQWVWLQDTLRDLRGPFERVEQKIDRLYDGLVDSQRLDILRSLSDQPYIDHHREVYKKVISSTGQWLLQDPQFIEWQRSSASSILWLRGIPGSGKSCLT